MSISERHLWSYRPRGNASQQEATTSPRNAISLNPVSKFYGLMSSTLARRRHRPNLFLLLIFVSRATEPLFGNDEDQTQQRLIAFACIYSLFIFSHRSCLLRSRPFSARKASTGMIVGSTSKASSARTLARFYLSAAPSKRQRRPVQSAEVVRSQRRF